MSCFRQRDFCNPTVFSIFCGTWNVSDKTLDEKDTLSDWLLPKDQFVADLFAIGFQEMVELSTMNVVFDGSKSTDRAMYWQRKITETFLSHKLRYVLIDERHLVGNLLCLYAKAELAPFIRGVRGATTPIGIMGVMGNKGAVVIRFRYHNTTVCLVCSHLSANRDNVLGRNADVRNINERTALYPNQTQNGSVDLNEVIQKKNMKDLSTQWSNDTALPLQIEEHDVIFWFGDLNYRIQDTVTSTEVLEIVRRGGYASLLSRDQLNIEIASKNVFLDFEEGRVEFEPTYKYQPGTDVYETRPDKKFRAPAWCDRVLWKENSSEDSVRQMNYRRAELNISDHRPVCALFNVDTCITDPKREKKVYQDLLNKVDKWENASAPKVAVENRVIDFGPLQVHVRQLAVRLA
jgi:inositol polyphosphate 5-phosphatase INPP5B/F